MRLIYDNCLVFTDFMQTLIYKFKGERLLAKENILGKGQDLLKWHQSKKQKQKAKAKKKKKKNWKIWPNVQGWAEKFVGRLRRSCATVMKLGMH